MNTRKSLAFSFVDRYASLLVSVISSMVIARLLTPADIGVFSVTMVLLMFVATVRDLGAGQYLVQEKELTVDRIRAVWAVQLGLGLLLAFLVFLASYPVAVFYEEPRMHNIMLVVALNYAINPFGSLTYAWQMREMRFDIIALIRFSASLAGAVMSVVLAWQDFGPMSLALGSLATTVVNAVMATIFRPIHFPWLPGLKEIKRVLSFGSRMTATSILNTIANGAAELLLGKLQSMDAAGLFSRATGLVGMIGRLLIDASYSVAISLFAKKAREQGGFVPAFLKAMSYVTVIAWPACFFLILLADPIIRFLYGAQWGASVGLVRFLAVATMFHGVVAICHAALVATGCATRILKTTVATTLITLLFIYFGSIEGLLELSLAVAVGSAINAFIWIFVTINIVKFSVLQLMELFVKSILVSVMAAVGPLLIAINYGWSSEDVIPQLIFGLILFFVGWIFGVLVLRHGIFYELHSFCKSYFK